MNELYCQMIGAAANEPVSFRSRTYDYKDVSIWLPKLALLFQQDSPALACRLIALLEHLDEHINMWQMPTKTVKCFLIALGKFFSTGELDSRQKTKVINFATRLIQSRELADFASSTNTFDDMLSLRQIAYWACQHVTDANYNTLAVSFIAAYSQLGAVSVQFLAENITTETRKYLVCLFDQENRDKKSAQLKPGFEII